MAYSYLVAAPQYGLIALWGRAALTGGDAPVILEVGLILLLVSEVMRPWLKLLQRTEPGRGAAQQRTETDSSPNKTTTKT